MLWPALCAGGVSLEKAHLFYTSVIRVEPSINTIRMVHSQICGASVELKVQ